MFISYSSDDRPIVSAAARLLRAGGAIVFQDVADIEFGVRWTDTLLNALAQCERVLVFWSASAAKSEWVEREWRGALEAGKRIVPMALDKTPMPEPLRQFQGVPDLMEMLKAAIDLAPPAVSSPASARAESSHARKIRPLAFVFGSAGLVALGAAVYLGSATRGGLTNPPDIAIGPAPSSPASTASSVALPNLGGEVWLALAVVAILVVVLVVWAALRARRPGPDRAAPTELELLGQRFTGALFASA